MRRQLPAAAIMLVIVSGTACSPTPTPPVAPSTVAAPTTTASATVTPAATVADWEASSAWAAVGEVQGHSSAAISSGRDLPAARPSCVALGTAIATAVPLTNRVPPPDAQLRQLVMTYLAAAAQQASTCVAAADATIAYTANPPGDARDAAQARLRIAELNVAASSAAVRSAEVYQQLFARLLAIR